MPGGGQPLRLGDLGDAEVGDDAPALVVDEDVAGLDVAVHHAVAVGVAYGAGDLAQDGLHRGHGQRAGFPEDAVERAAVDVLHDEVQQPVGVPDGIDRDDVGMAQGGGRAGLAPEPLHQGRAGTERRGNDLDGHPPVECNIVRGVDGGHAAATKLAEDLVLAQRSRAEELEFFGVCGVHGGGHPVGFLSGIHCW